MFSSDIFIQVERIIVKEIIPFGYSLISTCCMNIHYFPEYTLSMTFKWLSLIVPFHNYRLLLFVLMALVYISV